MKPFAALRNAVRHVIRLGRGREAALIYNGEGPAYREKTLGEWTALAKKDDFVVRKDAAWALAEIGLAAIPAIMELLKDKDTYANTTIALSLMGAEAKKRAIPALIELVQDKERDVQWAAIHALRIIGSLAVPSLTELLRDKEPSIRIQAALALLEIGLDARVAIPSLTESLRDEHPLVREFAALALGGIGPKAKSAVRAITVLLRDEDSRVQEAATDALQKIKEEKK